jgi:hypothetical protein
MFSLPHLSSFIWQVAGNDRSPMHFIFLTHLEYLLYIQMLFILWNYIMFSAPFNPALTLIYINKPFSNFYISFHFLNRISCIWIRYIKSYHFKSFILNQIVTCVWPPLWFSGQSSWLKIQKSRVRFPTLPDYLWNSGPWKGPLSLMRTVEELLEWQVAAAAWKTEINNSRDLLRWPCNTFVALKAGTNFTEQWRPLGLYTSLLTD